MNVFNRYRAAAMAVAFLGLGMPAARADSLISNGDFSDVHDSNGNALTFTAPGGVYGYYAYASTAVGADYSVGRLAPLGTGLGTDTGSPATTHGVAGWTFNDGAGIAGVGTNGFGVSDAGGLGVVNSAFLQSNGASISQEITPTSTSVTVTFGFEGRNNFDAVPNTPVELMVGVANQTYDVSSATSFSVESVTFNGLTPNVPVDLSFTGLIEPNQDATTFIADVLASSTVGSSAPVPLPASAGIGFSMLVGFGGLATLRKRLGRRPVIA